jgi:hypothetical protein
MDFRIRNPFRKKERKVTISAVNIRWRGSMHAIEGFEVKENPFVITIPFQNKTSQDAIQFEALRQKFKAQEQPPVVITGIQVSDPFKLLSIEPQLPLSIGSGQRITFNITAQAPDYTYTGPITVTLTSEEGGFIKVQINKVIVNTPMKSVEIDNSGVILNMPKGGIFKNAIQMYKAMSYGERVDKATIQKPFEFVSCDPKLPFTINEPSSYLVTFYVKAPDVDYAGPMEIMVE